mgnify:CR=1 FL=1
MLAKIASFRVEKRPNNTIGVCGQEPCSEAPAIEKRDARSFSEVLTGKRDVNVTAISYAPETSLQYEAIAEDNRWIERSVVGFVHDVASLPTLHARLRAKGRCIVKLDRWERIWCWSLLTSERK